MLLKILRQYKARHMGNNLFAVSDEKTAIQLTQALYAERPQLDPASGYDRVFFREDGAAKVAIVCELIQEWTDKKGHNKCWYYPEIFKAICAVIGLKDVQIPDITEAEFRDGCGRFTLELFNGSANSSVGSYDYSPFLQEPLVGEASQS
jgi:hypothetical protein